MYTMTWLVIGKHPSTGWFDDINIPFSSLFVVGHVFNDSHVDLFELYRVTADRPLRSPVFGFWSPFSFYIPNAIIYNRRYDLEGMLFRTGSTQVQLQVDV